MHRTEIKVYTRDLMTDDNSKEFLYLRDLALYGNRTGPTFDNLMENNTGSGMTQDQSYDAIIKSSERSNKGVDKDRTGSDTSKDGNTQ